MQNKSSEPSLWVDLYGDVMFRYCLLRVRNVSVAEDLVQEAFLGGIKNYSSFKGVSSEKTWLIGILKNKIKDYYIKNSQEINFNQLASDENRFESFFEQQIENAKVQKSWGQNPSKMYDNEEFLKAFQNCLNNIPEKFARIFTMREIEGMSAEEICKDFKISETNLWVLMHRARAGLKNCLEKNWFKN